jgi:hypothetical protein
MTNNVSSTTGVNTSPARDPNQDDGAFTQIANQVRIKKAASGQRALANPTRGVLHGEGMALNYKEPWTANGQKVNWAGKTAKRAAREPDKHVGSPTDVRVASNYTRLAGGPPPVKGPDAPEDRKPNPDWGAAEQADSAASFQEELARALAEKAAKAQPGSQGAVDAAAAGARAKELRDKADALKSKYSVPCLVAGPGGCPDDPLPGFASQPALGARVPSMPSIKMPQIIPRLVIPEFLIPFP